MRIRKLAGYCIALLSIYSCAGTGPRKAVYTIDSEMSKDIWTSSDRVKLKPGDIVTVEVFEANVHKKGKQATLIKRMRIPYRRIDDNSWLKDYERNFLLAILSSNATKKFDLVVLQPDRHDIKALETVQAEMVKLWNYIIENSFIISSSMVFKRTDIVIDWDNLPDASIFKDILTKPSPEKSADQSLVRMPRQHFSFYDYFTNSYGDNEADRGYYKVETSGDTVPYIYVSFSVEVNGLSYRNRLRHYEESTWSVYDWLHCGVFAVKGMNEATNKTYIKSIAIEGIEGRFRIKDNPSHKIAYAVNGVMSESIQESDPNAKGRKSLKETDLRYIFPRMARKVKFKKSNP